MIVDGNMPSIWSACAASGGSNGQDARATNAESIRNCRTSAQRAPQIRVRSNVGVTGGYVAKDVEGKRRSGTPKARKGRYLQPAGRVTIGAALQLRSGLTF